MSNANASTIKIRNLAHLLQQLDELGQPIVANNSDDVRMTESDQDRHLYVGGGSHHGSGSGRSQQSNDQRTNRSMCGRHQVVPTLSLDSQLVEQNLAYLLAGTPPADLQSFRRPRPTIGNTNRIVTGTNQRFAFFFNTRKNSFKNLQPFFCIAEMLIPVHWVTCLIRIQRRHHHILQHCRHYHRRPRRRPPQPLVRAMKMKPKSMTTRRMVAHLILILMLTLTHIRAPMGVRILVVN